MSGTEDYQLLHNTLIVATLLFAIGTIGFLTHRNRAGLVIALSILIQSGLTAMIGFYTFHGMSDTGDSAIIVLVGAAVVGILFALALRSRRPASPPSRQQTSMRNQQADPAFRDDRPNAVKNDEPEGGGFQDNQAGGEHE
ncbi:MAG: hypothetical protein IID45_05230 [Planctomycetes bacterium]|nr:hypothetical protein [Planctomycetota bacterium]